MKVYWVLTWNQYYPGGGLSNVHSQHETFEQALEIVEVLKGMHASERPSYIEIEDVSEMLGINKEKNT